ncbi:peptidylprolyl isomerase domain and WD repeat-containing protein 1-like [Varroa jacobsoni]|uniref:peptidylprolyl isomerase domain and WD repeat-containing protein 1-like n=1 Tax=Varroa jacobsoni TaxID=62625 RepID=UPI000BF8452B|nr:peptidylprolyl isomerase domain and WD repeat-containing protein 1-like [Varroa jacobsoni]XP_022710992.1 peptidylprolyl isomerase domain and WD repeat-containing protein 1-like [Varroa jacobsoni]XP_022710993.1 peptidylprolyl isomerase domain and WD repeat-containing protein 1-like [Varroa jacobsoni]
MSPDEEASSQLDKNNLQTQKRTAESTSEKERIKEADKDNDDDGGVIGPLPSEAVDKEREPVPKKKKKILHLEKVFVDKLPSSELFEKSYMHRDTVTHVVVTRSEFIVTASADGHVKFWKKEAGGIEFVKHFRAHLGKIEGVASNWDGSLLCTISDDKSLKVFEVVSFDLMNMLQFDYTPGHCEWVHTKGDAIRVVAVTDQNSNRILLYDGLASGGPLKVHKNLHQAPIVCLRYCPMLNVAVSSDENGILEYWRGGVTDRLIPDQANFDSKLDTDLFELVNSNTVATNIAFAPDGRQFAVTASDRKVRVFNFASGRLVKTLDETLKTASDTQQERALLSNMEFGRRVAVERELEKAGMLRYSNLVFDDSGNFLLYPTLLGIKVVNLITNRCVRILGKGEALRPLAIALYQGVPGKQQKMVTVESAAAENPALQEVDSDPTLVCSAYKKNRFYLYTKRIPGEDEEREVFNEKPSKEDIVAATEMSSRSNLASNAVIHTSMGDIHVILFPRECPRTVENFVVHSRNGYYNGHIFHRVIKGFMVQTGDPTGVGTGGESIWGGEFEDEFHPNLKHDKPYTLSMANAGPNTNGSQFFITVIPCPWLDNKHTVFGRVTRGMEVAQNISLVKTHPKTDKPYDDVTIVSITIK